MIDYRTFTPEQLAKVLVEFVADFDDARSSDDLTVEWLLGEVQYERAVFETEQHGIAVIRPEGWRENKGNSLLWLLFISNEMRGKGLGRSFVERLRSIHERHLPMVLGCTGENRLRFFESCGFEPLSKDSDSAVMISNFVIPS